MINHKPSQCLFIVRELIADVMSPTASCSVQALEYLFKFIVQSRILYSRATCGMEEEQFRASIQDLFQSIRFVLSLDSRSSENLVFTQVRWFIYSLSNTQKVLFITVHIFIFFFIHPLSLHDSLIDFCCCFAFFVLVIYFTFAFHMCCWLMLQSCAPHCCPILGFSWTVLGCDQLHAFLWSCAEAVFQLSKS